METRNKSSEATFISELIQLNTKTLNKKVDNMDESIHMKYIKINKISVLNKTVSKYLIKN